MSHVSSAGNRAKIRISPTVIIRNNGFNERDLARLLNVIEENKDYLLSEWRKLFTEE
ncbi:DUF4160 domain-containing protein [Aggregatilinea sp.]|uniref:DUF4160 domain-containing protein n=1 Tax=Aggregatilinea sp. TaxID=2806333 RepID=UPI003FA58843